MCLFFIESYGMKPKEENVSLTKDKKRDRSHYINSETVFNYNIKNQWEEIRNKNLLNCDKITILMKCTKCSNIFPLPLEIWNEIEDLSDHIHKCGTKVEVYDLKNNINAQHLKVMLSAVDNESNSDSLPSD